MILNARNFDSDTTLKCNVCIMGAGAAGITLAVELINSGLDIILLEAGGDFYDDESQSLYKSSSSNKKYPPNDTSRLRFFGGSTNHWEGSCAPLNDIDFEHREWVPNSGWPITKTELDPFYIRANKHVDLGPAEYGMDYWMERTALKPMIPDSESFVTKVNQHSPTRFAYKYRDALEKAKNVRVILNANVIDIVESNPIGKIESVKYQVLHGATGSVQADHFILSMGGLENSRMLLLSNKISENGIGNEYDQLGRYYMDHPVVKTAFVFPHEKWTSTFEQNIAIHDGKVVSSSMELSRISLKKDQMVNARLSFVKKSKYFVSEGVESMHQLINDYKDKGDVESYFSHIKNIVANLDMVAEAISQKKFGTQLFDDSSEYGGYLVDSMIDQVPVAENRIILSDNIDKLGLRKLHLNWNLSEYDKHNIKKIGRKLAIALTKSGRATVRTLIGGADETERGFNELLNFGYHHMGGTRMSDTPSKGVVDKNLRVHNRTNLYIAGSSVFPTGGHVPPTLTIVALSARLADHIKKIAR